MRFKLFNSALIKWSFVLIFVLFVQVSFSQTFQKYIKSTNNPSYTGLFSNTMGFDPTTKTIFIEADQHNGWATPPGLIKVDTCGNVLWSKFTNPVGTSHWCTGSYYNGGYALLGRSTGPSAPGMISYVMNYDGAGNLLSTTGINATASGVVDLNIDASKRLPNGDMLVTGYGPRNNNFKDIFFGKLSSTGAFIWGGYTGGNDFSWENGWGCDYDPANLDSYFVGQNISFSQPANSSNDIHILKTDANGVMLWEKNIATIKDDIGWCVKVLPNRDVVVVGTTANNIALRPEICFIKFDAAGNFITSCKYQGTGNDNQIRNIIQLPNGNLLLTGHTNSFGAGGIDALNMAVDSVGNIIWQKAYGTADNDHFVSSIILSNNYIFSAGARDFGNTGGTGYQLLLTKTDLNGNFTDPSCASINGTFVKVASNFNIFNASNILNSGLNINVVATQQNLNTQQTIICGKPTASFTPQTPICANQTISLFDQSLNAPNSWTWTSTANNIPAPNTQNQASVTFTAAGTYTVKLKVSNCIATDSISKVIVVNPNPILNPTSNSTICAGATLSLTASSVGTYTWTGPGAYTSNVQNPVLSVAQVTNSGVYTVSVTNASGCVGSGTVNATIINTPTANIASLGNNPLCIGESNTLTASGATTYTWLPPNNNSVSVVVSPTVTTTYTLIGANAGVGCSNTAIYIATVNAKPIVSITGNTVICNGQTATLTGNGASSYVWNTGSTQPIINPSPTVATTYSVIGTNAITGCTNSAQFNIAVNQNPIVLITGSNAICNGQNATLTASGANTYTWNTGFTTNPMIDAPITNTTYTVIGTVAATGCTNSAVHTVSVNSVPNVSINGNNIICLGQSTTLTASGANTYLWNSGATNASVSINPAANTTYTVIGTNSGGSCTNIAVYTVTVNTLPVVSISGTSPICLGSSAALTANGASSYIWNTGSTQPIINPSPTVATTYSVIGTDGITSCTNSAQFNVAINQLPTVSISGNNAICIGNGFTLTAAGANTYTWDIGATTSVISSSPNITTTYSVIGTNAATGCTNSAVHSVTVNNIPNVLITGNNVICRGQSTTLTASGANSYLWNSGVANASVSVNPSANTTYTVTGTNSVGSCTNTAVYTVTVNSLPVVSIAGNSPICRGSSATLTANGANSYIWNTGVNQVSISPSPTVATTYSVIGTSAITGCTNSAQFNVAINQLPNVSINGPSAICNGQSVLLTASGSTTFTWNTGTSGNTLNSSPTINTTYSVIGTRASTGCTNSAVYSVTVYALPNVSIAGNNVICLGQSTGLTANGASTYLWNNGLNLANISVSPSSNTTYTVVGTSAIGSCTNSAVYNVTVNPLPLVSITGINAICIGGSTSLTANGANSYLWNTGSSQINITPSPTTTTIYSLVGVAVTGCTNTAQFNVVVNPKPNVSINGVASICNGQNVILTAFGAHTYVWNTGSSSDTINSSPINNSNYSVIGTDTITGCNNGAAHGVTVNPIPNLSATISESIICAGRSSNITVNGANTYTWTPSSYLNMSTGGFVTSTPGSSTDYIITGSNGICTSTINAFVEVIPLPDLKLNSPGIQICYGQSTPIYAIGAQNYLWSPSTGLSSTTSSNVIASPLSNVNYTIMGYNQSGTVVCSQQMSYSVIVVPNAVSAISNSVAICEGEKTTLHASGGNSILWAPTSGLSTNDGAQVSASPSVTTVYTVQVSHDGNCSSNATVLVKVNPKPTVIAGRDTTYNLNEPMFISAKGTGTLTWIAGEKIICADCPNSQILATASNCYLIEAVNNYGCKAQDEMCIEITKEFDIYVPNTFTPNDDGINDVFLIYAYNITDITMDIFDRWGEKLFSSKDITQGWNGIFKGQPCADDVYVYKITYKGVDKKVGSKVGHITLTK